MQQVTLYTLKDSAAKLGISRMTLYRKIRDGLLPPPAVLKDMRVYSEDQLAEFKKWIKKQNG
jgi:excisionase family DNA binding protein